jgi:hypothetical protein
MYRDNGLGAATRVQNSHMYRIDKIRKFEEDKIVNEQDIKEKREIAQYYHRKFNSKPYQLTYYNIVECSEAYLRFSPKVELVLFLERKLTFKR